MPPQPPPSPEPRPGQGQPTSGPGEVTTPPRERVGLGLLAAIVAVVGGVVVTFVVAQLGFIAAISSFVIAFGATFLYEAAAGRPARRGLVPLVVLIVLGVALSYAALLASDLWDAYAELGLTDPSRTTFVLDHVMSPGDVFADPHRDVLWFVGFGLLGVASVVRRLFGDRDRGPGPGADPHH